MQRLVLAAAAAAVALASFAFDRDARAQELRPVMESGSIAADMDWGTAKKFGSSFPLDVVGHFRATEHVYIDMQLPVVPYFTGGNDSTVRAGLGNPNIGVHYAATPGNVTWFVGGRLGFPLGAVNNQGWQLSLESAQIATSWSDLQLWALNSLPIGAYGGIEAHVARPVMLRASLEPTLYVPVRGDNTKTEITVQARFEIEARSRVGLGGGAMFQVVGSTNDPLVADTSTIVAIEPFFSYDSGGFFLRAGILCPVSGPTSFCADSSTATTTKIVALHLMLGGHLD